MKLLLIALAPVFIIAAYIYFRDKYEKEPIRLLLLTLFLGCLTVLPVIMLESFLERFKPDSNSIFIALYDAFVVAGFSEELFKFLFVFLLIWNNKNFNEKFDGIVYAVFVSLGFAGIENIMYVFQHGELTGYTRAVVSVPGHTFFGITMGFYLGLARFYSKQRMEFLIKALAFPIVLHGIFDFILMLGDARLMVLFLPFVIYLYIDGFKKMKNLSTRSIYRK
ncbi:MAG: PrsW family intramembrane metalloprotease [Bacteroidales bacterium]|nr:PrsW family intramembrane metalloprotease [Bacteroidales bacterium]MBN2818910.1 PrsW family intramembrane metalloprotease [Bacteroidales bacterium]